MNVLMPFETDTKEVDYQGLVVELYSPIYEGMSSKGNSLVNEDFGAFLKEYGYKVNEGYDFKKIKFEKQGTKENLYVEFDYGGNKCSLSMWGKDFLQDAAVGDLHLEGDVFEIISNSLVKIDVD